MRPISCPCCLIAAPSSGCGKTTVTAALARWHTRLGRKVTVFKIGPDYIDPQLLAVACDAPVYNLDLGMMTEEHCQDLLYKAASNSDLILLEGMMGLYDGQHSAAQLAKRFGIATLLLLDVRAMAQTAGALALGLSHYDPELRIWGVMGNRVASPRHGEMVAEGLPSSLSWLGAMPRDETMYFPERHLGLQLAQELPSLIKQLDVAADHLTDLPVSALPPATRFHPAKQAPLPPLLQNKRIAVARDAAFSFIYAANLDCLLALGAELVETSPVNDHELPDCDALYLPGGYPELHADKLSGNTEYHRAIQRFSGPVVAECGGMLYLLESLTDPQGRRHSMVGSLPGIATMQDKLQVVGWQQADLGLGLMRGHSFHYSTAELNLEPQWHAENNRHPGEAIYRQDNITASYLHWYFYSNPAACAALFGAESKA